MSKYVDIEKIREEIEKLRKHYLEHEEYVFGWNDALTGVDAFLEAISCQEDDLDKDDVIDYAHSNFYFDKDFDGYGHSRMRPVFTREDLVDFANHFFELGKKCHKGHYRK